MQNSNPVRLCGVGFAGVLLCAYVMSIRTDVQDLYWGTASHAYNNK